MKIEAVQTLSGMEALAGEWNSLLSNSASDVPFLRFEYLKSWWNTLGGGEWDSGELYIVTGRAEDGKLAGILPLFYSKNRQAEPALLFLGCIEISDYLDIIARSEATAPFIREAFQHLSSSAAPDWRVLDLYNLVETSATIPVLEHEASQQGWNYTQEHLQHCPYISLPGDWETYLASIDKKQRHEIRRKMRRLESETAPRWYIVQDPATLESEVEAFLSLMAQDPEKKHFLTPAMCTQMHISAQAAFQNGWLQLSFLELAGKKAAGYMNFDYQNRIWVYNSGINYAYRELSPGWVLLGYLLQWANENKRAAYDFMRGDEEYKYRFGAIDQRVTRAMIRR
jgi:CelD/BcsL family acetyltransferase involved in cellulose biosynthesis